METTWKQIANSEEKDFLQKVVELSQRATKQNRLLVSDFYVKGWMTETIIQYLGQAFLNQCDFYGAYEGAERQCILFGYESYYEELIPVTVIRLEVKTGLGKPLTHRDYLGALLGLGIERCKIGDIILKSFGAYIVLSDELGTFVETHLTQVSRYQNIEIRQAIPQEIEPDEKQTKELLGTVPSLRADAIFALGFGMSRAAVVKLLQAEKGKRNGMSIKVADIIKEEDILTLRGYGKVKFVGVKGQTKKDRFHVQLEKYI